MDPHVKRITRVGRNTWMLFGVGFLGVGILIAILLMTMRPWPIDIGEFAVLAGVPVFLGAVFVCVRSGVVVDRQRCILTTWWGLLVPNIYRAEHSFSRSHDVTLSYEVRHGVKNTTYAVYPVRLEGPGTDAFTIHEPGDHDKARQLAEELAKFLHLGIRDRSSAEEVARAADALDQPIRERMRHAGQSMPLPAQPPGAIAILSYGGIRAATTIEIPPMPVGTCARWFVMGMLVAGALAFVLELVARFRWDVATGVATLSILLPALVILTLVLIRAAILRERLVVSPHELVVTRRDVFGTRTTRLKGADVEEVALIQTGYLRAYGSSTNRVAVRGDHGSIELGAGLSNPSEVRWLRDVLVHAMTVTPE